MDLKYFSDQIGINCILILIAWFTFSLRPFSVYAIDLQRVVRLAMTQSFEIKRLRQKGFSANMRINEKQAGFAPIVGLNIYHMQTDKTKPVDIDKKENDYAISFTQPLYKPGLWHDYQEAVLNARMVEVQLRELKENLTFETLSAVIDICRIRSRLVITGNSLMLVKSTVDIQQQLLQAGYGSRFDLIEAEVELARYQKEVQELDKQLQLKLFELQNMSGTAWAKKDFPIIMDSEIKPGQESFLRGISDWVETAYRGNSQLMLIRINRELNELSRARGYSSFKPQVDMALTYHQAEEEAITKNRVDESSIKLSMSMTFSPVRTYYQIQRLGIEDNVLSLEADKVKKNLSDSINKLFRSMLLKSENMKAQRLWKAKQKMIVDLFRKGLKQKHFPFSRFLDSSRKFNESQHELAQAFIDIWEDRIRLLHLSGQLKTDALAQLALDFGRMTADSSE